MRISDWSSDVCSSDLSLPFALTGAQQRVFAQVREDLGKPVPMLRPVQGDVGSGKTVVAALAAMVAVEGGRQAALMAPTRSEARRVGKECVSTCRSRWAPYH